MSLLLSMKVKMASSDCFFGHLLGGREAKRNGR